MKYKKGDLLRITQNGKTDFGSRHCYSVGDIVRVRYTDGEADRKIYCEINGADYNYVYEFEVEPYTEPFDVVPPEDAPPTKRELHRRICDGLNASYIKKNSDYGDSYSRFRDKYENAVLMRIFDKFCRLEELLDGKERLVEDETIEDTLLDMSNYCIMEVVERRLEK